MKVVKHSNESIKEVLEYDVVIRLDEATAEFFEDHADLTGTSVEKYIALVLEGHVSDFKDEVLNQFDDLTEQ